MEWNTIKIKVRAFAISLNVSLVSFWSTNKQWQRRRMEKKTVWTMRVHAISINSDQKIYCRPPIVFVCFSQNTFSLCISTVDRLSCVLLRSSKNGWQLKKPKYITTTSSTNNNKQFAVMLHYKSWNDSGTTQSLSLCLSLRSIYLSAASRLRCVLPFFSLFISISFLRLLVYCCREWIGVSKRNSDFHFVSYERRRKKAEKKSNLNRLIRD